jgi:hypothetical protein
VFNKEPHGSPNDDTPIDMMAWSLVADASFEKRRLSALSNCWRWD